MDLDNTGTVIGNIPVHLHHRILDLFSANLYSSPNKAFEELVSNSYDASADSVCIYMPSDLTSPNSVMWVCDNGAGMDDGGLRELWNIGYSRKREGKKDDKRPPIGKFGIGKLATYVLGRKLTHICKSKGKFLAVTMDYGRLQTDDPKGKEISLNERELTEEQVVKLLKPIVIPDGRNMLSFNLWGGDAADSWTIALMSDFTPKVQQIKEGRLKWVLSTALPLSPGFNLYFNGKKLDSSKIETEPIRTWVIGEDDNVVKNNEEYTASKWNNEPCVNLPHLNNVRGRVELYEDSLLKGKSQELGRSHGIFLMIRGRLVNIDEPLIGTMEALHHGTFNRMRFIVCADELDANLTSGRESIADSPGLSSLQKYIQRKFNEVKTHLMNYFENEEMQRNASYKIARTSMSLSRRPLLVIVRKFLSGEIDNLMFTKIPPNLNQEEKQKLIENLESELLSEGGIIKEIEIANLGSEKPIAEFNLVERKVKLNFLHPFIANFAPELKTSMLPFKLIATNEILTEAFMIEAGIDPVQVREVMERRDQLLREVMYSDNPNTPQVAMKLRDSVSDDDGLEDAVYHAFNNLGFQTSKVGGSGKPDGEARACLRDKDGARKDYSLTYDAKSTEKDRIQAKTSNLSGIVRHRTDYNANYSVVVAIDFAGAMDPNSAINKEAKQQKVTLIKTVDLCTLILLAAPREVNLADLKDFLDSCHTVVETSEWIKNIKNRVVKRKPIKELIETVAKMSLEDNEVPSIHAIRKSNPILEKYTINYLTDLVKSLQNIVGHMISINDSGIVSIQSSPKKILEVLDATVKDVPQELMDDYVKAFDTKTTS